MRYVLIMLLMFVAIRGISQSSHPIIDGGKVVKYHLYVKDTIVNFGGKSKRAIAVNRQIPMPTLTFTEGDTAEIMVHNLLDEATSLHWHGVMLPNTEDGVPWLTQKPIDPHSTYTYRFPIIQHGTHWYHSHSGLQEHWHVWFVHNITMVVPNVRTVICILCSVGYLQIIQRSICKQRKLRTS